MASTHINTLHYIGERVNTLYYIESTHIKYTRCIHDARASSSFHQFLNMLIVSKLAAARARVCVFLFVCLFCLLVWRKPMLGQTVLIYVLKSLDAQALDR